jgi:hypothetical protein
LPRKRKTPPDGRVNSGGARAGQPGRAYANRSDMTQAPRAAGGQTYGEAAAQTRAQQAVPLPWIPPPGTGGGAPPGPPGEAAPPAPGFAPPGSFGAFDRPTERPAEPVTAGAPSGPGAGPEALSFNQRADADLESLRPYLPTLELLASQPDTSVAARNFIRRIRGGLPPTAQV